MAKKLTHLALALGIAWACLITTPLAARQADTTNRGTTPPVNTPTDFAAPRPVLRINQGAWPQQLDPQKSYNPNEISHLDLIYEGLTRYDTDLNTVPGAAASWSYNANATVLTFTLRPGLKYSDGSLLNARRFEYSILRNIDPATASEYGSITDDILNAPEWRSADPSAPDYDRAEWVAKVGIKALDLSGHPCTSYAQADCLTLKIMLSRPAPYFHTVMGMWVTFPAKQENIEAGGADWWMSALSQVGNGPFVLQTMQPGVRSVFTPNANYWRGQPKVDIENRYIEDTTVALEAYRNNELDIITPNLTDLAAIGADPELNAEHLVYSGSCTLVIKFGLAAQINGQPSPMQEKKVREAFALAFDAAGWSRDVDAGGSVPTWTWIPPGLPGYDAATPLHFDPAAARAALTASTYGGPDALNALGLKLTYSDSPLNLARAQWLAANYKTHLDVNLALDPVDSTTYSALARDPTTFPLLTRQGWCADFPDPQNWLSVYWRSTATWAQRQGYANPQFDALVDQADVELNPATRLSLYQQAQQLLLADIPAAFGYNNSIHHLVQPWVKGITTTPFELVWPGERDVLSLDFESPTVARVIPAAGGVMTVTHGVASLIFPSGTFTQSVVISYTQTFPFNTPAFGGLGSMGQSYDLSAVLNGTDDPVQPAQPYTVVIHYTDYQSASLFEKTLALYSWNGSAWVKEPSSQVDTAANTVTAAPAHFSQWAVLGEPRLTLYLPLIRR